VNVDVEGEMPSGQRCQSRLWSQWSLGTGCVSVFRRPCVVGRGSRSGVVLSLPVNICSGLPLLLAQVKQVDAPRAPRLVIVEEIAFRTRIEFD
jgi:hypothetical protein